MVKKFFKKASKRLTCRKKYKIEKKVREHNRKMKKESKKKNRIAKRYKMKKDPGVPNRCPFKEKVLKEAQAFRNREPIDPDEKKLMDAEALEIAKRDDLIKVKKSVEDVVREAVEKRDEWEKRHGIERFADTRSMSDSSLRAYYKEFRKVIEAADVILQVLDARDPQGTRCAEVEKAVAADSSKRLVLVLNKADLVPKENLLAWLRYLRAEYPTIAFKASTQTQHRRLGQIRRSISETSEQQMRTSQCLGAGTLLSLLGNYCRNKDIKTAITVGVVGLPNVGKSSIINSLKRSRACNVGSVPGVTKHLQEVQLDSKVKLLDSPGVVFVSGHDEAATALKNALRLDTLDDVMPPAMAILQRMNRDQLMIQYNLPMFDTSDDFFALLAKKMGKLMKGGVPNCNVAARKLLQDWTSGKLRYHTVPPERMETHLESGIVSEMAKEFSLDELEADESKEMDMIEGVDPMSTAAIESEGIVHCDQEDQDGDVDMDGTGKDKPTPSDTKTKGVNFKDPLPENLMFAALTMGKAKKRRLRMRIDQKKLQEIKDKEAKRNERKAKKTRHQKKKKGAPTVNAVTLPSKKHRKQQKSSAAATGGDAKENEEGESDRPADAEERVTAFAVGCPAVFARGNERLNKMSKVMQKKRKKAMVKAKLKGEKAVDSLADTLDSALQSLSSPPSK